MKVSVLVISRTAQRLNRMLTSLEQAFRRDVVSLIRQSLPVPQASGPAKGSCSQG